MWDQSCKELVNIANDWFPIVHIKNSRNKFQISNECLPTQFLHPNTRLMTFSSNTHWIPKDQKESFTTHMQQYNVKVNDPLSPHYTSTCKTNLLVYNLLNEVLTSKNLPPKCHPDKEGNLSCGLNTTDTFPREEYINKRAPKSSIEITTLNSPLLYNLHLILSEPSLRGILESIRRRNEAANFNPRSLKPQRNVTSCLCIMHNI